MIFRERGWFAITLWIHIDRHFPIRSLGRLHPRVMRPERMQRLFQRDTVFVWTFKQGQTILLHRVPKEPVEIDRSLIRHIILYVIIIIGQTHGKRKRLSNAVSRRLGRIHHLTVHDDVVPPIHLE